MEDYQTPAEYRGTQKLEGTRLDKNLGIMAEGIDTSTTSFMHSAEVEAQVRERLAAKKRAAPAKKDSDDEREDPLAYEVDAV